jgi:hypothetical protein
MPQNGDFLLFRDFGGENARYLGAGRAIYSIQTCPDVDRFHELEVNSY